jgi:hypothetical protein
MNLGSNNSTNPPVSAGLSYDPGLYPTAHPPKGGDEMQYLIDPSSYTLGARCKTKHIHPMYGVPVCRQIEL